MRTILITLALTLAALPVCAQTNPHPNNAKTDTAGLPIPEEARKHFVKGTTLFNMGTMDTKDAKSHDDLLHAASEFKQAADEFKQTADFAPQWPEARYNVALAKEAAGDYSGAMADLKIYQQFKLSESEARTVQDKIYALEVKAEGAASIQAEEQRAAAAQKAQDAANEQARAEALATWTDPATGLMWAKDVSSSDGNWYQASNYCSNLRLAGYSNWRLPTIDELEGIYDPTQNVDGRHVKGVIRFHDSFSAYSSSAGKASGEAWNFGFGYGRRYHGALGTIYDIRALCVRRSGE